MDLQPRRRSPKPSPTAPYMYSNGTASATRQPAWLVGSLGYAGLLFVMSVKRTTDWHNPTQVQTLRYDCAPCFDDTDRFAVLPRIHLATIDAGSVGRCCSGKLIAVPDKTTPSIWATTVMCAMAFSTQPWSKPITGLQCISIHRPRLKAYPTIRIPW